MDKNDRRKWEAVKKYATGNANYFNNTVRVPLALWNKAQEVEFEGLDRDEAISALLYVAGKITEENRDYWYSRNGFDGIPLQAKILRNIIGSNYNQYLFQFEINGLIESSPHESGVHAKLFNIERRYQKGVISFQTIESTAIKRRVIRENQKLLELALPKLSDSKNVIYWLTGSKLSLDKDLAYSYLEKLKARILDCRIPSSEINDEDLLVMYNEKIPTILESATHVIERTFYKQYDLFLDSKGWRVYSNITLMMSPLRNFLSYDSQELWAIDISNSQPFHFCFVLSESFWHSQKSKCNIQTLVNEDEQIKGEDLYSHLFKNCKPLLTKIRKIVRTQPEDIVKYIGLTQSGEFYDYLSVNYKNNYSSLHGSRESSKKRFVTFLNFDNSKSDSPAYSDYRKFKEEFPNVCFVIEAMKSRHYKDISKVLQRLEAKMLLHYFAGNFAKEFPDVPLFSVHDTIVTLKSYKEGAKRILNKTYFDIFKLTPPTDGGEDLNYDNSVLALDKYLDKKNDKELHLESLDKEFYNILINRE